MQYFFSILTDITYSLQLEKEKFCGVCALFFLRLLCGVFFSFFVLFFFPSLVKQLWKGLSGEEKKKGRRKKKPKQAMKTSSKIFKCE